jgi:DNA-binding transcriptional MerR regulator
MASNSDTRYTIRELVQVSGIPRRTIRYYVQRGLLEAPEGAGRGHFYTGEHLEQLLRIRQLQEKGRTLDDIGVLLSGDGQPTQTPELPALELATRIRLGEGLELIVGQTGRAPSPSQLRALAAAAARILDAQGGDVDAEH